MAIVYTGNWDNPTSTASVDITTTRDRASVTITATVTCNLTYSSGYIEYDGEINFNMWCTGGTASANIKSYSDRWSRNTARSRVRTCSMTVTNLDSSILIGFNITPPTGQNVFRTGDQYTTVSLPSFNAPTAPTWIGMSPNPCSITQAPLLYWGGASVGSWGYLYFDVEVRSSTPSGGWTDWLRLRSAQVATSFQETTLSNMNVQGQTPFLGVSYQYRVRSSDGTYSTSDWVTVTLTVTFGNPTPPTSYTLSNTSVKKDGTITISWSGASGGSGTISSYELEYRIYNNDTSTWGSWTNTYSGTSTTYTYQLDEDSFSNGDLIQFRIRVKNSWGQYSSYLTTTSVTVRANQMWLKQNDTWVECETYLKVNGTYEEVTPYIKVNGVWYEST